MAASMSHPCCPIQNLSTQVVPGKKLVVQTTMAFIREEDYNQLHTNDGIVDVEGQCVTNWIETKICAM
jgi:hypothetical protein